MIPIPKKGDHTGPNNYRGITLMGTVVKVLAAIIADRVSVISEKNSLLCKAQAGF